MLTDKGGGVANYDASLISTNDGWICRFKIINSSPDRYVHTGLSKVELNGHPTMTKISDFSIDPGETREVELHFPRAAAKSDEVAELYCWVKLVGFGFWSNTLHAFHMFPDDTQFVGTSQVAFDKNAPLLQIFSTTKGWVCRFSFTNDQHFAATYSVQKCWLNGQEPIFRHSSWTLLRGQSITRDLLFPASAATAGTPAEFRGYYQIAQNNEHFDLREYNTTLHPKASTGHGSK